MTRLKDLALVAAFAGAGVCNVGAIAFTWAGSQFERAARGLL
jgi:hypothetical protein